MRVQLTTDHSFQSPCGGIKLLAGTYIGTSAGDYPIGQISNFAVTVGMIGLDGAATSAIATETVRVAGHVGAHYGQTVALVKPDQQK